MNNLYVELETEYWLKSIEDCQLPYQATLQCLIKKAINTAMRDQRYACSREIIKLNCAGGPLTLAQLTQFNAACMNAEVK